MEPFDFEDFLSQYQLLIDRDPLRTILDVPAGDVEVEVTERPIRTLQPILPEESMYCYPLVHLISSSYVNVCFSNSLLPHVQACVRCYTSNWKVIRYNYRYLSSSVSNKLLYSKVPQPSIRQEFEVDFQGVPSDSINELGLKRITCVLYISYINIS